MGMLVKILRRVLASKNGMDFPMDSLYSTNNRIADYSLII
jgi:hypothetical protein